MSGARQIAGNAQLHDKTRKLDEASIGLMSRLQFAAQTGQASVVAGLLAECPESVDEILGDGGSALHVAAKAGHEEVVAQLLARRPDVIDRVNHDGWTALHCAASKGHAKVVALLLDLNPKLLQARGGWTAFHIAVNSGHRDIVRQLLVHDPKLSETEDFWGLTALHCAVFNGQEKVVNLLLEIKPEHANVKDSRGNTLLHHVATAACARLSEGLVHKVCGMNAGALQVVNSEGCTPFQAAIKNRNWQIVKLLQWQLSIDEIVSAFLVPPPSSPSPPPSSSPSGSDSPSASPKRVTAAVTTTVAFNRVRPVVIEQCEPLFEKLHRDVLNVVFEYIGIGTNELKPNLKRKEFC